MVPLKPQISPVVSIALRNMERKYVYTSLPPLPIFPPFVNSKVTRKTCFYCHPI